MSVGTLQTSIVLDDPKRIHCGNSDPVLGHISIKYSPGHGNASTELFGPLKVHVTLHGRAKTKIWKSNGQNTNIYRGRAPLFAHRSLVYDDSFRALPGNIGIFPFKLFFPQAADALVADDFSENPTFICHRNQPLPASFQDSYRGFAHRYEAFVEYRIGVDVVMPQLQVEVIKPIKYLEPVVHYEGPRTPQVLNTKPIDWRGIVAVSNELLLPEADRPAGFRQKTKAFFGAGHFPTYSFDWVCLASRELYLGQPACFEVRIKPREKECTATLIPEVWLKSFHVKVKAHTKVRAHRTIFSCPESEGNYTVFEAMGAIDTKGPFSKANDNTKIVNTQALGTGRIGAFPSSFATYNISQDYSVEISFEFEVTGKTKNIDREYAVNVLPPLEVPTTPPAATAGPSSQPPGAENKASDLPPYDTLPPYELGTSSN
ncbi:hypothetical protein GQX73_g2804 [Xylaria multiplex]|uniref:Arrestin-like N-terminal domain-containing protein n=1 Tax=Xylaria multiplex TaxID=323545 RepID=A0A7C8IYJ4_9PEZI|nr:hypothetical protein GQX73_g2804 [Xylaria multiplex]